MAKPEKVDDYLAHGEVPDLDPHEFRHTVAKRYDERVLTMGEGLMDDHEVVTIIGQEGHPSADGTHKKEIIAGVVVLSGLTVAGILAAIHHMRVKHKD